MKNISRLSQLFCTIMLLLYLSSCVSNGEGPDSPQGKPYMEASVGEFAMDCGGGVLYATVESNRKVTAKSNKYWCEADVLADEGDDNLRLTIMLNRGAERRASVVLSAAGCPDIELKVTQAKSDGNPQAPYMGVADNELTIDADGGVILTAVNSNRSVTALCEQRWCRVEMTEDQGAGNLRVTVDPNKGEERTATILLTAPGCSYARITVTQYEPDRPKSGECDLLSFRLSASLNNLKKDVDFTPDGQDFKAVYLKWIEKPEPAMMIPTFTTNGEKVTVEGKAIKSGVTAISFANDLTVVVKAENGDTKTYSVSLNCPQINTELPVLRLRPDSPITSKDVYVNAYLDMYSPTTASGWWGPDKGQIRVRGRGNSTWGLPKKPYRLKFPEKYSPIGLDHAREKDWVILAHDMDKSLLRNHIAFRLSRVLFNPSEGYHDPSAVLFTSCSQFVNLYMGDNYHGLYQMSDQMERGGGRIAVDKLTAADGDNEFTITGGYILETDIHPASYPERFSSGRNIQINRKYPKDDDHDLAQYRYIEDFVKKAESVLYGSNFKDPVNGWRRYFDDKTLADFIIVKEFAGDFDGYTSTYMYKRRGVDKIFFGPIWDVDKGWDNDRRNTDRNPNQSLMIYAGFYMPPYVNPDWFHRFWQDETFRAFVGKRWAQKRTELVSAVMTALDTEPVRMAKAIEANFSVWQFYYQYSGEAKMPAATYALEIERMRGLTRSRAALLDRLFK